MNYIESQSRTTPVKLFYEEAGSGKPVVFIHGWPMNLNMWEYQFNELPKHFRCIAYDRRGFGKSTRPWDGYDYDTLALDLKSVLDELDLNDVTLVGFSMGGGEVIRYLSLYGDARISKIVLISSVVPYMLKADDNPDGLPKEMFDSFIENIKTDRPAFLKEFGKAFFGVSLINHPVSEPFLGWAQMLTTQASAKATIDCINSFSATDFRSDVKAVKVPTLIIHGDEDKTVPVEISSNQTAKLIPSAEYIVYKGEPHGLFYTAKDRLNADLVRFIGE